MCAARRKSSLSGCRRTLSQNLPRPSGSMLRGLSKMSACGPLALFAQLFDFLFGEMFNSNERIFHFAYANELVQLDLDGCAVAILGILNQEDH